jgi:uncharacterized protein (TIGR02284 family)
MTEFTEELKSLHTQLVDSMEGYRAALEELQDPKVSALVSGMIAMRSAHHRQLDQCLHAMGEVPDESGSFMSNIHRTIIKIRSVFTGVDENIVPGLIDGESRILEQYGDCIRAGDRPDVVEVLQRQSRELAQKIHEMEALRKAAT